MGESISQRSRVDSLVFSPESGSSLVLLSGTACIRKPGIGFRSRENAICLVEKGKNLLSQWHGAFCDMNVEIFITCILSLSTGSFLRPGSSRFFNLPRSSVYLMP